MKPLIITAPLLIVMLSACSQQQQASLVDNRHNYYGRNGSYAGNDAIPRYSDTNRADQGAVAYKYQTTTHTYGVDAAVPQVAVNDLPPPSANTPVAANTSPFAKASEETLSRTTEIASRPVVTAAPAIETAKAEAKTIVAPVNGANLAFRWPTEGKVISRFGPKTNGLSNDGINIAANKGEPIMAAADGEVAYVGNDLDGYGNLLILRHREGWMTSYAHAQEFLLNKGDTVTQGDVLGYVGATGSVKTPQLHFSVREGKIPIDPESVLSQQVAGLHR